MAELKGKKRKQPSSRPEGWLAAAIVVQLELTCRQLRYANRCVGIARFVYNRLAANDQGGRDARLWLTPHELEKEFNAAKQINPALAFVTQVSKFVAQGACRNYRNAHSRWRNPNIRANKPVFHKKNRTGSGSFLAASGIACIQYDHYRRIRLPYLAASGSPAPCPRASPTRSPSASRTAAGSPASPTGNRPWLRPNEKPNQWAASTSASTPSPWTATARPTRTPGPSTWPSGNSGVGNGPRPDAPAANPPGSRSWKASPQEPGLARAQQRIDAIQRRIKGLRNNAHHQVSRTLVRKYHTLGIESLNVSGMIRAGLQSKALSDAAMSNLLRQVRYKAQRYGTRIVEADQQYPSSKTCSACGVVNQDLRREPQWPCPACGQHHERNLNAARNLLKLALLAVGEDVMLRTGWLWPAVVPPPVKPPRMKGEPSRQQPNSTSSGWPCNRCYPFGIPSGINCVRYDNHRRIRLPYLGSVRMTRALPEGMPYEVTISRRNGRWYASIAYWNTGRTARQRNSICRRSRRRHQSPRRRQRRRPPQPRSPLPAGTGRKRPMALSKPL